jgi:WD40 repeat protein
MLEVTCGKRGVVDGSRVRCLGLALALALAAMVVQSLDAAGAPGGGGQGPAPTTVVQSLSTISSFAQDGDSLAWCSDGVIYVRRFNEPGRIWATYGQCGYVLALANGRVLWDGESDGGITEYGVPLVTASPGTRPATVGELTFSRDATAPPIRLTGGGGRLVFLDVDGSTYRGVVRVVGGKAVAVPGTRFASDLAVAGDALATIDRLPGGCVCNDSARWSPDGARLAFASRRDGNSELYTIGADGGDLRRVTSTVEDEQLVGWSFDGRKLAFFRTVRGTPNLIVANADGTGERRVAAGSEASWSPVSRQLVYTPGDGIWVVNDDGSGKRRLANAGSQASWSPDGRRLVFISGGGLRIVNLDGTGASLVAGTADARQPRWSPDGSRLAYVNGAGVFVRDLARGVAWPVVASDGADEPSWSPDGAQLLFVLYQGAEGSRVFVGAADGSGARRLRSGGNGEYNASWSPDGGALAFTTATATDAGQQTEIAAARADGSNERQLTDTRDAAQPRVLAAVQDVRSGAVRFTVDVGSVTGVLLSSAFLGVIVGSPLRLELYDAQSGKAVRHVKLPNGASTFSMAGTRVVFRTRRTIRLFDGATGRTSTLAVAGGSPVGLSIVGSRVAWAENAEGHARVRDLVVPLR